MIKKIKQTIHNIDPYDFSLILVIFFIITHFQFLYDASSFIATPILLISAIGFLFKESRKSKLFWIIETVFYLTWLILNWQTTDNHMYLWGYILISITVSLYTENPKKSLIISAKGLILCCMGYAVIQKLNVNFLSGDFFYFTLITDSRFNFIGPLIQYNLMDVIIENNLIINELKSNTTRVLLNPGPNILNIISKVITWYIIFIELTIVILFALPRKRFYQWQHWGLLLFLSTYFILPIKGFAYSLITLGFFLIKKDDTNLKLMYIGFIIYIFSFSEIVVNIFFNFMYPIF